MDKKESTFSHFIRSYTYPALLLAKEGDIVIGNSAFEKLCPHSSNNTFLANFPELKPLFIAIQTTNYTKTLPVTFHNQNSFQWVVYEAQDSIYPDLLICLSQPITALIQAVEQTKKLQTSIIDLLPNHYIFWKNRDSVYLGCNKAMANSMGLSSPQEIIGKTDFDLPTPKVQSEIYRADDREVIETGRPKLNIEERQSLPDGEKILLTSKVPLLGKEGGIEGIVAIYTDITEQKKLQHSLNDAKDKAEAANLAKTEFLENMRHDIRTPLSGIVGFAEILKSESKEATTREYADNLIASSFALLDLMDDVLEAVRVSSGEIPMLKRKFDLKALLNNVINLHLSKSKAKKLQLNCLIDEKLPQYVIGDKIRLHRVVLELVGNALNFTNNGHVTLTAELARKNNRQLIIRIKVNDSGIGIPEERQQDIYLQFKRFTPSYKGLYKGTGLGLYIVKQFIDELDAEISVNSQLGVGTSFTCIIPLQEPLLDDSSGIDDGFQFKDSNYLSPINLDNPDNKSQTMNKILVVEDNKTAQKVVKMILTSMQCEVDLAANGKDALTKIGNNHYDLIFMDIGLGEGADGYEVTQEIRRRENQLEHVPIVALTAHAADENKQRCVEAGMDAVLSKPITTKHASNIINAFLRKEPIIEESINKAQMDLPDTEEELFQLDQYPILETEQTTKNIGGHEILIELLENLVNKELPEEVAKFKNAYKAKDFDLVEKLAHKMKGGAVYVGTIRMKFACQYLERYRKSGQHALFDKLYNQAITVIEKTETHVKKWLDLIKKC